ncbi:amidohydrolase [Paeniglutamicibacter cryotolerans]|uniref:Amidohydrolase 3 domain-containing protein n=1 Tax=Paeniglutamicibacter cryotolerans TaxID=670079 RepID=A0A839QHZ2_9MICC|nr:amidohydrolase [Paeniglutamicibacter cryotolerans]MBB2994364.1 hypothetical protein [Paeniglutamicibacter cryotolerans]
METGWFFHSGRIFDGTTLLPEGTGVLVRDSRVAAVGPETELDAGLEETIRRIDLGGNLLTPGFSDAHVHTIMGGVESLVCDLTIPEGIDDVLATISAYASASTTEWITGGGWSMSDFPGGTPTAEMLDSVTSDRPAYLINRDHHGAWVNSRALEIAGITASTPDPSDGRIERDAAGNPTGTLHEGAMDLVTVHVPVPDDAAFTAGLLAGQAYMHSFGVTGWQEAILGEYAGYPDVTEYYHAAAANGTLTAHAVGALWVPRTTTLENIDELVADFIGRRTANAAAGFPTNSAKIMVDGVAENQTAALLEPYLRTCTCTPGDPDPGTGLAYLPVEVLNAVAVALDSAGFDLHLHVIGDRAARIGLDAIEAASNANGVTAGRHHLAHLQIIHPDDLARFGALGVTANAQALWACNEPQMTELTLPILGEERSGWQYPFRSLIDSGAPLAMGSDWAVSTPDPWHAIHVAVNRRAPGEPDSEPLVASEAITMLEALTAYTHGSAWINRDEEAGSIRTGSRADLVAWNANPFDLHDSELYQVGAALVLASGSPVHEIAAASH